MVAGFRQRIIIKCINNPLLSPLQVGETELVPRMKSLTLQLLIIKAWRSHMYIDKN